MTTNSAPAPVEIAYRIPGKDSWKRRTFKTEAAAEKWIDKLTEREGDDIEFMWRLDRDCIES